MNAPTAPPGALAPAPPVSRGHADLSDLTPGARVNLRLSSRGTDRRVAARLAGVQEGTSLIVLLEDSGALPVPLCVGDKVYARCVGGRMAFGFATHVIEVSQRPVTHYHLAYPDAVESVALRNAERVPVDLPAFAADDIDSRLSVDVRDLSETGALICTADPVYGIDDAFRLDLDLTVGSDRRRLTLQCTVRNVRTPLLAPGGRTVYRQGVEFSGTSDDDRDFLRAFVQDHLQAGVTPFEF